MTSTDTQLGMLIADVANLKSTVDDIQKDVRYLRDTDQRRKGALKLIAASSAAIGGLVSLVVGKLL